MTTPSQLGQQCAAILLSNQCITSITQTTACSRVALNELRTALGERSGNYLPIREISHQENPNSSVVSQMMAAYWSTPDGLVATLFSIACIDERIEGWTGLPETIRIGCQSAQYQSDDHQQIMENARKLAGHLHREAHAS